MRRSTYVILLVVGASLMTSARVQAQAAAEAAPAPLEVAVTYNPALANVVSNGNTFWMQGASIQATGRLWRGLGMTADVALLHTAHMHGSGPGLDLVTACFGARYAWPALHSRVSIFGRGLVGEANGIDSIFPSSMGANSTGNSLALEVGGGVDVPLSKRFAVRAFQADWLRTQLPNDSSNVQNNVRAGAGLVFRFH